jgi:KUP system potassium uptake protein
MGALGVVFGDIGTSPLYAMRECLNSAHGVSATHDHVLGILSLIIWSLVTLITIKYISVVMRADNDGEGGMLALLALGFSGEVRGEKSTSRVNYLMVILALLGTSFLFGEGIITPAISVLSAVEGLKVAAPGMDAYIVPITVLILLVLFSVQSHGTEKMGVLFGPVTLVWFITIGILGLRGISMNPDVLNAFNPWYALKFLIENKLHSAMTLGGVFLVVTGGEALYADMGHFGRQPIRYAWFAVVMPALLLNYLGQGALVLANPSVANIESPFHRLAPEWFSMPLVILGAMAAVIASQALISGAFSLTSQAIQMGFIPRLRIEHTSEQEHGQIYSAPINHAIMVGSIALVLIFKSSSALAAAYGIAVCLTMLITSILLSQIAVRCWHWSVWKSGLICGSFMLIEIAFVSANLTKVMHGGFVPLVIGAILLFTMLTWKRGRRVLSGKFADMSLPLDDLVDSFKRHAPVRVRGTAVFLTASPVATPGALLHNLKHNKILHEKVIVLSLQTRRVPRVKTEESLKIIDLGSGIWRVVSSHGFMEQPDVPAILKLCGKQDLKCDPNQTSYFLGRETIVPTRKNMPVWQAKFFALLCRSSQSAMEFFKLPPNRVIELGTQIEV